MPIDNVMAVSSDGFSQNKKFKTIKTKRMPNPCTFIKKVYTDYDKQEEAVVLATTSEDKPYATMNFKVEDIPRYSVVRDKVESLNGLHAIERVSHLEVLDQFLLGKKIEDISFTKDDSIIYCVSGEDWCLYIDQNNELHSFVMESSKNKIVALEEMKNYVGFISSVFSPTINPSEDILKRE